MRLLGKSQDESGNVFLAIFAAVAMVGILSGSVMTFMKGPLSTSIKLTKMNTAENQMAMGAQVAVMATSSQPNNGDCDADTFVEPMEWRTPTTEPVPVGGGLVPLTLGISKKDPWGTEYGYCVWNHGPTTSGSGCDANMLTGTNSNAYPVVAIISAGPDKTFTTTCRTFAAADVTADGDLLDATDLPMVSRAAETDDDIITSFTYQEATGVSGGLWSIKSGEPGTAVINKNIETSGTASLSGGLLLPDKSLITCDATTAGVMAMNGDAIEICDGTGNWTAITGGAGGGVGISLDNGSPTPNVSSGMDIDGTCGTATCYSDQVVFTLKNNLTTASDVLAVSLTNTANFEFVSDNCNGNSIAAGATCQIVVRAKASGNVSYAATLNVIGNNSPLAMLDGTASNFPGCNTGGNAPGGFFIGCAISGHDLVITPGGCVGGTTNPTCAGGVDTTTQNSHTINSAYWSATSSQDGAQNTANLIAYSGGVVSFPAADYCDDLIYAGYSDWFLPSLGQLTGYFYPNRAAVGGSITSGNYISSSTTFTGYPITYGMDFTGGLDNMYFGSSTSGYVRCMRWEPTKIVTATADTTPVAVTFGISYGAATGTRTSNAVTIHGVTEPTVISISGSGGPTYSINGGAYTSAGGTVTNGDQVTLRVPSPASGQETIVTLTIGLSSFDWSVRSKSNNIIRVFTRDATNISAMGGAGGADSLCTSSANAAGLQGVWVAVIGSGHGVSVRDRLPWNWSQLRNMNGALVATSIDDFMDGTISAPMNRTETGAVPASDRVWTGLGTSGVASMSGSTNTGCAAFTSTGSGVWVYGGITSATSGGGYFQSGATLDCNNTQQARLLCMEAVGTTPDTTPENVTFTPSTGAVVFETRTSNTVTVHGINMPTPVSMSGGIGTPTFSINGGAYGASGNISAGQTLTLRGQAPQAGNSVTYTLNVGTASFNWVVRTQGNNYVRLFTTSTMQGGNLAGVCAARAAAASLPGTWALLIGNGTTNTDNIRTQLGWNWKELRNMAGQVIATSPDDFVDGDINASLAYDESGASITGNVWTGIAPSSPTNCSGWSYTGGGVAGSTGMATATTGGTYLNRSANQTCHDGLKAYCIETTPQPIGGGPSSNDGYFVITEGTYTGNLGGRAGADALCLTELTDKVWLGKATAQANGQLDAAHVKAFLCDASVCTSLTGSSAYHFAAAGLPTTGGAYFVTDSGGVGPNDAVGWTGSNYFGSGGSNYWSGRQWGGSNLGWPNSSNANTCSGWTTDLAAPAGTATTGAVGRPSVTTNRRWAGEGWSNAYGYLESFPCNSPKKLVCAVNP